MGLGRIVGSCRDFASAFGGLGGKPAPGKAISAAAANANQGPRANLPRRFGFVFMTAFSLLATDFAGLIPATIGTELGATRRSNSATIADAYSTGLQPSSRTVSASHAS